MSEHSTFPPRAMTPLEAFDSRPKIAAAQPTRSPVDPFEGLPRIPRAPRLPSGTGPAAPDLRDTDPIHGSAEATPTETPFSIRVMLRFDKLEKSAERIEAHSATAANAALEAVAAVRVLTGEVDALKRRVTALELADRWVPRFAWAVTTAIALLALLRTYR